MRKIIAAFNMTLDGFCDHTSGLPDEEIHQHYTELLGQGDAILYGRITFELMEFWRTVLKNPSEDKSINEFATAIDKIPKIVFSRTIENTEWESATIAKRDLRNEVIELKQQSGNDIFIGSRSLIIQLLNLNLIDEFQLCIFPVVVGNGLPLFDNIKERITFKLNKTKTLKKGAVILYYQPIKG
ncbi:Dihydrofolate reductase [Salinimicrobium catena]|uniref:Dihydrofolate reductase n=1 Tax=Salinimicrobium catena TaxID=390640 RepID=A0A1H5MTR8_9FLAO|nr:dihydrofolate reductase family protein [Salinimicrobium catena]SDL29254.1 Dihydrofolate reductase [Salinimicrobium catena]SEE92550.1 Dihydrofolate reductase [Salinimicrobium catena]